MSTNPRAVLAEAYEAERFRWEWRRDRMSGRYQILRERDDHTAENPSYEVKAEIDDLHAAENMAEKMGQDAGARAAFAALAAIVLDTAFPDINTILQCGCARHSKEE